MPHLWSTFALCLLLIEPAAGIVTSDTSGSHVVTAGVPAFGLNLDGVGIVGGAPPFGPPLGVCSSALVSDVHVLTAAHCFDDNNDGVLESPMAPFPDSIVFELASGQVAIEYDINAVQLPDTWPQVNADLAIVTLNTSAPLEIPRYALCGGTYEVGQQIVLAGYGDPGHGATGAIAGGDSQPTKRAGLNRYDAIRDDMPGVEYLVYDFDSGMAENNALEIFGYDSDLGFSSDEVDTAPGDSGGPAFVGTAIAGVTAFGARLSGADVNDTLDSTWGEGGFDTRVSLFREFILEATGGAALYVTDGDFDKDADVDGRDFLLWQRQFGDHNFPRADGTGDGVVDAADYTLWRDNFGTSTATTLAKAVPEPRDSLLLISGVLWGLFSDITSTGRRATKKDCGFSKLG